MRLAKAIHNAVMIDMIHVMLMVSHILQISKCFVDFCHFR